MNFIKLLSGDAEIVKHIDSSDDIVFVSDDLECEGFHRQDMGVRFDHVFEFGTENSRLWINAPTDGEYYVALQVLDTYGTYDEEFIPISEEKCGPFCERLVELSVGGRAIGTFRFGGDDKKYYIFVTEEPIKLKKGDEISYKILAGERAIFTAIVLMKQKPKKQTNSILNITSDNGEVRFWTKLACRARLIFGEQIFSEEMFLNNHRFTVPEDLWGLRFIIEVFDEEGNILRGRGTCHRKAKINKENKDVNVEIFYSRKTDFNVPVITVLPLLEGAVYSTDDIGIFDEQGNFYPSDCTITSRWQNDSLRTVSVEAILPTDGRRFYIKNEKANKEQISGFSASKQAGVIVVSANGKSYYFRDDNSSILPDREINAVLYDENGRKFVAEGGEYVIDRCGKNHITITRINHFMCEGKRHMKCLTHVHFYRDIDAYSLEFGFENDLMENEFSVVEGLYLEQSGSFNKKIDLLQLDENTVIESGKERTERFCGHFNVDGESLIVNDFWQNYPKSVTVSEKKLKIGICPFITMPERYRDEDIKLESRLFFYLKTGKYEFHCGMRKYHNIIFGNDADKLKDIVFLNPDPKVVEASEAFGHIKCDCPDFAQYDEYMSNSLELYMEHREKFREYGMLNYGDSFGEREIHWTNMEYDFPYGMLIHFLRTGDERFYQLAKSSAAHYAEIDNCHRSIYFEENGYYFIHTVGHANNYYEHKLLPPLAFEKIKTHIGHLFSHGMTEFYKVTGIERYKEAVVACADSIAKYHTAKYDFLTEREPGWGMLTLEAAYELTLDEYYLNACRIIVERILQKQDPKTGCLKQFMYMVPQEGAGKGEVCYGGKSFMHGIVGSALKYYYNYTKDERARTAAIEIARWLAEDMYDKESRQFWYTDAFRLIEKRVNIPETNIEILDVVLYACLEGKEEYLELAREAFELMLESPYRRECDISKIYSMRLRFAPEIMYYYNKARKKYGK